MIKRCTGAEEGRCRTYVAWLDACASRECPKYVAAETPAD